MGCFWPSPVQRSTPLTDKLTLTSTALGPPPLPPPPPDRTPLPPLTSPTQPTSPRDRTYPHHHHLPHQPSLRQRPLPVRLHLGVLHVQWCLLSQRRKQPRLWQKPSIPRQTLRLRRWILPHRWTLRCLPPTPPMSSPPSPASAPRATSTSPESAVQFTTLPCTSSSCSPYLWAQPATGQ